MQLLAYCRRMDRLKEALINGNQNSQTSKKQGNVAEVRGGVEAGVVGNCDKAEKNSNNGDETQNSNNAPLREIEYLQQGVTKMKVIGSQSTVLHVFDDWKYEITSTDQDKPKCLKITWNSGEPFYIPKIIEYVDDKQYEFDAFALLRTFKVETQAWICESSTNNFVKIQQNLTGILPLNAIMFSGSVQFDLINDLGETNYPDNFGKSASLHVHAFIDLKTKQLVKYVGGADLLNVPSEKELKSLPETVLQFRFNVQE
ncbi:uncharacterized protein LOC111052509 [Nilaparvata lugens]|uniref:uncharacterized protein LOC111052509 n=1 Tax=Nilaparvata lugens TaxID=108931 RepID=UPI00193E5A6B|nr:uncharacterized protein LOC111052509 [Nilaparvata lugens]